MTQRSILPGGGVISVCPLFPIAVSKIAGRMAIVRRRWSTVGRDLLAARPAVRTRVRAVAEEHGAEPSGDHGHAAGCRTLAMHDRERFGQQVNGGAAVGPFEIVAEPGDGPAVRVLLAIAAATAIIAVLAGRPISALAARSPTVAAGVLRSTA